MSKNNLKLVHTNITYTDKKTGETKIIFDRVMKNSVYMLRADNRNKFLSEKAARLLTNYYDMIKDSPNGIIFVDHDFISSKTYVSIHQNKILHKQLRDIFKIQYHKSIRIDGKKCYFGFTIEFTENTENILKDPELFYSSINPEIESVTEKKFSVKRENILGSLYIEEENLKEIKDRSTETPQKTSPEFEALKSNSLEKTLKDFYPISGEDCLKLQIMSGRDFNLNATNEILLDMSKRLIDRSFNSKKGFMMYFGECLRHEKRDAVKIEHETFKIKANQTEEERHAEKMYRYLEKVENSLEVSPELHFKKKIACVLPDEKAYDLLTAYRSLVVKQGYATLYLRRHVELSPMQFENVLNQVQASHPSYEVEKLELSPSTKSKPKESMETKTLDDLIIQKFGASKGRDIIANYSIKKIPNGSIQVQNNAGEMLDAGDKDLLRICIKETFGEEVTILAAKEKFYCSDTNELWKKFKKFAQNAYYKDPKDADLVFSTWFEKLKATQNIADNKLILTGSAFIISHIDSIYSELIEAAVKGLKINIQFISERGYDKPILYKAGIGKFERMSEEKLNELMKKPFAI